MIFDHVMQDMSNDEWWRQFRFRGCIIITTLSSVVYSRFLGKWISQYLSEGVDKGKLRDSMIESGLDYDRWKNTFLKLKNVKII